MKTFALFAIIFVSAATAFSQTSVYTDLSDTKCKTLRSDDEDGILYKGECAGVAGYKLHVIEGDLRQSIDVVFPNKTVHQLRFWEHFMAFSYTGPRAEWRIKNKKPFALIVRLNVSEDLNDPSKTTSYLIVSKITKDFACVTDVVKPSKDQNVQARKLADASVNNPCMVTGSEK